MNLLPALIAILFLVLPACTVGPTYQSPSTALSTSFKNAGFTEPPPQGSWWTAFGDSQLQKFLRLAEAQNPSAQAALARFDQARALLGLAASDSFPAITANAFGNRQRDSGNSNFSAGTYEDYRSTLNLSWEIDLWGRVRRQTAAAAADSAAAAFDYRAALLSLQGEVARTYFSLRLADSEISLLRETESLRAEARRLMKSRFQAGASSEIDYHRTVTEHESIRAELAQLEAERARFENALATLLGQSPSQFHLATTSTLPNIPNAPAAVPSDLLRRRPDLAASERRLAAASERIGLAIASFLPRFSLNGEAGFRSLQASDLFNSSSKLWSLGPSVDVPIFQGGRAISEKNRADANYREALANYRDTLLRAVRETEDSLVDSRQLARAASARQTGSTSARTAATLVRKRYQAGATDYFEVVDAERTSLTEQRAALAIKKAQLLASTRLIQSLGGGWKR